MIIIVHDHLTAPPSSPLSFRHLTLFCSIFLKDEIVIESEDPDPYYRWLKDLGCMDFVEDFVRPGTQRGLHLDTEFIPPDTIITDRIVTENLDELMEKIRSYHGSSSF